jgi:DNA-binding LacI/PurR family transcriptional regulator
LELGVQVVEVGGPQGLERAFAEIHADRKTGTAYAVDSLFLANRRRIAQLASRPACALWLTVRFT